MDKHDNVKKNKLKDTVFAYRSICSDGFSTKSSPISFADTAVSLFKFKFTIWKR
jgi:hypothetical protein